VTLEAQLGSAKVHLEDWFVGCRSPKAGWFSIEDQSPFRRREESEAKVPAMIGTRPW
jgi:hypothetical protein